jgi:hypothetical protein
MAPHKCNFGSIIAHRQESLSTRPPGKTRRLGFLARSSRMLAKPRLAKSRLVKAIFVAFATCIAGALALAGDLSVPAPTRSSRVTELPIKLYEQYLIVIEGRIGNLDHQHLLLDTGTNPSMIDKRVAAKLGLQATPRTLSLFNKNVAAESVMLPDLEVGPMRRRDLPVMVADFSSTGRTLGTRIDGIIGLDVLGATNFTVDYSKRRILFHASAEAHTAPFSAGQQFITVNLKNGARQLHLLLDTGTPDLVLFQSHLSGMDYEWSAAIGSGHNISGNVGLGMIVLQQARLGTQEVGPQQASVVSTRKDIESDLDGLLGVSCFHPKRISFDFERNLLAWSD